MAWDTALTPGEVEIIGCCLRAASEGPFFPDWEFETLFGVSRSAVSKVADSWPAQTLPDRDFDAAVIGSMNHLLGYPHGRDAELRQWVKAEAPEIEAALDDFIAARQE